MTGVWLVLVRGPRAWNEATGETTVLSGRGGVTEQLSANVWAKEGPLTTSVSKVLWEHGLPSHSHIVRGAFVPQEQTGLFATETLWPTKPKVFSICLFAKQLAKPCIRAIQIPNGLLHQVVSFPSLVAFEQNLGPC